VFERFTDEARQVIALGQEEARLLKHNYIGTEHLLAGCLREEDGLAAAVLEDAGVRLERVRAELIRIVGTGDEVTAGQIPFTPRAKHAMEIAVRDGLSRGHTYVGTEHLLLGVLRVDEGVAVRVLTDVGAEPDELKDEVVRRMVGAVGEPADSTERRRRRIEMLDAVLAAADRREEVARVVGEAADEGAAAGALESLLGVSRRQADAVLATRLTRWTRDQVESLRAERAELAG
jgi:ATP-dependent Clp protease ATP-binding subunit ClpA